jgi:F-type H+-transporting ATPase subunit c
MDIGTAMTLVQTVAGQAGEAAAKTGFSGAELITVAKAFSMAIAIGVGVFAPGLSEGLATAKAVEGIARNPGASGLITRTMIVGQAITESNSIYALLIALLIMFAL